MDDALERDVDEKDVAPLPWLEVVDRESFDDEHLHVTSLTFNCTGYG